MSNDAQCEPWVNLNLPAIGEVYKAIHCLHLEVRGEGIVEDVQSKVSRAFSALWAASQDEINEVHGTLGRTSELLTKTANALKGEPGPLSMHNWADLPAVALKLKQERDASINAEMRATERAARAEEFCKDDLSHPTYPEMKAQVEKLTKERDEANQRRKEERGQFIGELNERVALTDDLRRREKAAIDLSHSTYPEMVAQVEKLTKERDEAWDLIHKKEEITAEVRQSLFIMEDSVKGVDAERQEFYRQKDSLRSQVEKLTKERDEARSYGERLYQGALSRKVTCVYCGHEYPDGTPTSQDQQLTEHIKVCEKHPMRKLEQFKALVHKWLDEYLVPKDPVPGSECRVKARLDWLREHMVTRF